METKEIDKEKLAAAIEENATKHGAGDVGRALAQAIRTLKGTPEARPSRSASATENPQ